MSDMSAFKNLKVVDPQCSVESNSPPPRETNWQLCVICQEDREEQLASPMQSKRNDLGSGYTSLAKNLVEFSQLGLLPLSMQLDRLDEGCGIKTAMSTHNAQYHESCRLKFNKTSCTGQKSGC